MTWPAVRLADLCEVITKGTTPTTLGFDFSDQGIPFLRVQNIHGGTVNYECDTLFIDQRTHQALERSQIQPGDVLVSIAGTIGRTGVIPENAPALNCNQAVAIIRTRKSVFRPFLRHWLESSEAQMQMVGAMVTGTISNLSLTQVGNLKIPMPPLVEQCRIATTLDQAEALQAQRRAVLSQLDTLTQAIFLDLFGDPANNEKGWPVRTLADVCKSISDIDHKMPRAIDGGVPFISAKDLTDDGRICFDNVKTISNDDFRRLSRKSKPEKGDIIYSRIGVNLGKARLVEVDFDFLASYSCCTIKPDLRLVDGSFLCYQLDSAFILRQAHKGIRAIAVPDLGLQEIKDFTIAVPPMDLQREFARRALTVERLKTIHRASLNQMDALFASLQHRAFRGEL